MDKLKMERRTHFTLLEDPLIDYGIGLVGYMAFCVYLSIIRRAGKETNPFPSIRTIAASMKVSKTTVQTGLKILLEHGFLSIEKGEHKSNTYVIKDMTNIPGLYQNLVQPVPKSGTEVDTVKKNKEVVSKDTTLQAESMEQKPQPKQPDLTSPKKIAPKKGVPDPRKMADLRHLFGHVQGTYAAKYKHPMPKKLSDGNLLKSLLGQYMVWEVKAMWDYFLERNWDYTDKSTRNLVRMPHNIQVFKSQIDVILEEGSWKVKAEEYRGPINPEVDQILSGVRFRRPE